jgi:two-component system, OmpR family, response regulator CpxR
MKLLLAHRGTETSELADFLKQSGFDVDVDANNWKRVLESNSARYDLAIIKPAGLGVDAFNILREVKSRANLPVIVLTEQEDWQGRVRAFNFGAEDCFSDPFRPEELLASVCAILRRRRPMGDQPTELAAGDLRLSLASRRLFIGDRPVKFTGIECEILELLMRCCGSVVSRDQISLQLYNRLASPFDRAVDTHVSRIRRKLGETGRLIVSVRGTGYQLCIHNALDSPAGLGSHAGSEISSSQETHGPGRRDCSET